MQKKIWAYLIHLSKNMWGDPGCTHRYSRFSDTLDTDEEVWRQVIDFLPSQGIYTVVIDVGDGIQYESHPEISVKGAWSKDKMKRELDHIRSLGMTPIPKLNFSAGHDAWLREYSRMLSTPIYYKVCEDLIREVAEVFDYPEYFHLGMDEEDQKHQRHWTYVVIRQNDLWWDDLYRLFDVCDKVGSRPWVWAGLCWHKPEEYLAKMPKSVLQSNWKYEQIKQSPNGTFEGIQMETYLKLDKAGFDQVLTSSALRFTKNTYETMQFSKEYLSPEHVAGHMTSPWFSTIPRMRYGLLHDALQFGEAKRAVYSDD